MMTRNEIIEMLMANVGETRLYDHFDVRAVAEGFADQLVLINDEHCKQLAMLKAEFDVNIAALRREMDSYCEVNMSASPQWNDIVLGT
jgi:hypothetical protein